MFELLIALFVVVLAIRLFSGIIRIIAYLAVMLFVMATYVVIAVFSMNPRKAVQNYDGTEAAVRHILIGNRN